MQYVKNRHTPQPKVERPLETGTYQYLGGPMNFTPTLPATPPVQPGRPVPAQGIIVRARQGLSNIGNNILNLVRSQPVQQAVG